MKGMFIKDIRMVLKRKQQIFILLAVCLMIAFSTDGSFVIGYTAGLLGMLGMSTLGFDEHENTFPFLFSLPVDVKTYVNGKYLFCILADLAGVVLGSMLFFAACAMKGNMALFREDILYSLLYLPATLLLILTILPIQMIFGIERSRIITMVLYGILFVLSAVIVKVVGPPDQAHASRNIPEWLSDPFVLSAGAFALVFAVCFTLYCVCMRTMRNREF